jgi:hypothetical protein
MLAITIACLGLAHARPLFFANVIVLVFYLVLLAFDWIIKNLFKENYPRSNCLFIYIKDTKDASKLWSGIIRGDHGKQKVNGR